MKKNFKLNNILLLVLKVRFHHKGSVLQFNSTPSRDFPKQKMYIMMYCYEVLSWEAPQAPPDTFVMAMSNDNAMTGCLFCNILNLFQGIYFLMLC